MILVLKIPPAINNPDCTYAAQLSSNISATKYTYKQVSANMFAR